MKRPTIFGTRHEVLPLQREYKVDSESKLKEALAEEGRSLDNMRQVVSAVFPGGDLPPREAEGPDKG